MKCQKQINTNRFSGTTGFINRYRELVRTVIIPYQYEVLNDRVEGVEKSHVIANFVNAAASLRGEANGDGFYGMVFQDSDLAKWIEEAAYSLASQRDEVLENKIDDVVELISKAMDSDGYLNTCFTIEHRERRWKNLLEGHELYCSGHMMEAAAAYYQATGKRALLDIMLKNMEHIYNRFVTGGAEGYPGHPEIELALLKLYRASGDRRCLELAKHFIDVRGVDSSYYEREIASRDWNVWGTTHAYNDYQQSGAPVRSLNDATGHSVRAVYLYTAMADLAGEGDSELYDACKRLWKSITERRMYVTGGIGSTAQGEAFTVDYDLPNASCYCETCASIGLMFFASRMLEVEALGEYGDIMELALYNTVLAGLSLDGKSYFYVNPLEADPQIDGKAPINRHIAIERFGWHTCACCPPNAARLLASIGSYAYGENEKAAFCHLFAEGTVSFENGMRIRCETRYPFDFTIRYVVEKGSGTLAVRMPGWSKIFSAEINGISANPDTVSGYAYFNNMKKGDKLVITLSSAVRRVYCSSKISQNNGRVAIKRGPLVFCFEGVDNNGNVNNLVLPDECGCSVESICGGELDGMTKIVFEGMRIEESDELYSTDKPLRVPEKITAVPYFAWANRGAGPMQVWISRI